MKDCDIYGESSYIQYWDVNNLYDCAMFQKVSVNSFEWIKVTSLFNEDFKTNFNAESDERYFLKFDVQYLEKLHELHNDLPFSPEIMKIGGVEKLVANLNDETEYIIHIINFKRCCIID